MAKYLIEVQVTDKAHKKGMVDFKYISDGTIDEVRKNIINNYFKNSELRSLYYSVGIRQSANGKEVGSMFPTTLRSKGKVTERVYAFVKPNYTLSSDTYVVNKNTGRIEGIIGYSDEYVTIPGALGTGMSIRTGAKSFVKPIKRK